MREYVTSMLACCVIISLTSFSTDGFVDKFRKRCALMQTERLSVDAYSREFGNLARYATEEVSTDAKKQARFRKGLSPELRRELGLVWGHSRI